MRKARRELIVLAGPNGAGKTTLAREFFPQLVDSHRFVNADDIAARRSVGPSSKAADFAAGREAVLRRRALLDIGEDFAVETTLAGAAILRMMAHARSCGYAMFGIYLWVPDPELCVQRIATRVAQGGHFVPKEIVYRRHAAGLANLPSFLDFAERAEIYSAIADPELIARKRVGRVFIESRTLWRKLRRSIRFSSNPA